MMNISEKYAWLRMTGYVEVASPNTGSYHCVWTSHGGIHITGVAETYTKSVEFDRCL